MDVILIYRCAGCEIERKAIIGNVSVRDRLELEKRLPDGWTITLDQKRKEIYVCDRCQKMTSNPLTPPT